MSIQPRQLIGYGLVLLAAVGAVGCKDDGDITDPGAITLGLNPTGASVAQGGNTTTSATLTRSGDFTGSVTLSVTGAPAGVTSAVSNIQTTGLVSVPLFLPGGTVGGAYFWLAGGATGTLAAQTATRQTFFVLY